MAQRVRIGLLQNRAAVAVDHDRGGWRRIASDFAGRARVAHMARDVNMNAVPAVMMPRVRRSGGVGESRTNRGNDHNATAKPVPGFGTRPTHWHPVPDPRTGARFAGPAHFFGTVRLSVSLARPGAPGFPPRTREALS